MLSRCLNHTIIRSLNGQKIKCIQKYSTSFNSLRSANRSDNSNRHEPTYRKCRSSVVANRGPAIVSSNLFLSKVKPFSTMQHRFASTEASGMIAQKINEIDLANFKIPDLPTNEEIEAFKSIIDCSDLHLTSWLPTGLLFEFFSWLHASGVDWPVTIIATTLILRTLLLPVMISSRKEAATLSSSMKEIKNFREEMERAQMTGNIMDINKIAFKYRDIAQEMNLDRFKGMKKLKMLQMPIVQALVFSSFFITLRKMCNYPIESLQMSSFLWVNSLADKDPFYLLPLITAGTLFINMRLGLETGTMGVADNTSKAQKSMIYILPIGSLLITCNFPAALGIYWCTSNFYSLVVAQGLKIEKVRTFLKMPQIEKQEKTTPEYNKSSIVKLKQIVPGIKGYFKKIKLKSNIKNIDKTDGSEFERAGKGPLRKTYKYDPTKQKF